MTDHEKLEAIRREIVGLDHADYNEVEEALERIEKILNS